LETIISILQLINIFHDQLNMFSPFITKQKNPLTCAMID